MDGVSLRDPLISSGEGEFHSYIEEKETATGYSVAHLDAFLSRVYHYYTKKGFFCIILNGFLNLIAFLFAIFFTTFLVTFVDYHHLEETYDWNGAIDFNRKFLPFTIVALTVFSVAWVWNFVAFLRGIGHHLEIKRFYRDALHISERDLQTMEWHEVAVKLGTVKRLCRTKDFLSVLDVSARIMRKENYFIAFLNKDLLNLKLPVPGMEKLSVITKTMEWSLSYALFDFVFDDTHAIRPSILDPGQRKQMAAKLAKRFRMMGFVSLLLSPFMFLYLVVYTFFKYGEELSSTPGSVLGTRDWTPLARWKFREFNELPHQLQERLNYSYKPANEYLNQFPIHHIATIARFVSFIAGSALAVDVLMGIWDEDLLTDSHLLWGKSPLFFAGVLGAIVAVCRSVIPEDNELFEPVKNLEEVSACTHYYPPHWNGRAHLYSVRDEFASLFNYQVVGFLQELAGVWSAPFIMIFSLPYSSLDIVDFFRNYTVDWEGVGFVCSFSAFDMERPTGESGEVPRANNFKMPKDSETKLGKLEKSILTFKVHNPSWAVPSMEQEVFSKMSQFMAAPTVENNGLWESPELLQQSTVKGQSMSVISPDIANYFGSPESKSAYPDPRALAFLHKVHQQYQDYVAEQQHGHILRQPSNLHLNPL